ncbi:MAG: PEP-CTERM sorting domain-containing protein [Planctomycetota bacterium]
MPFATRPTPIALSCAAPLLSAGTALANNVYYAEVGFGDSIERQLIPTTLAASTNENLVFLPGSDPRSVALDIDAGKVYYAFGTSIGRANLDGTGAETVVTGLLGGVDDLELDTTTDTLYFNISSGTAADRSISKVQTDGTGLTVIHSNASLAPNNGGGITYTVNTVGNLSLDTDSGRLYWTSDNGANGGAIALNSSTLAGASVARQFSATSRSDAINKMDIDFDTSTVYYTVGSTTQEVRSSTLTGGSFTTLASGLGSPGAIGIDTTDGLMYFSVGGTLYEADLDGSDRTSIVVSGSTLYNIADIEVDTVPEPGSLALLTLSGMTLLRRRR